MFTWSERQPAPPVETAALRGSTPTRRTEARGRCRTLLPQDITTVRQVPTTTPLRTALDLGCCLQRRDAMAALNAFAREHGVTPADMTAQLGRYAGRRGVVQLRTLGAPGRLSSAALPLLPLRGLRRQHLQRHHMGRAHRHAPPAAGAAGGVDGGQSLG